MINKCERIFKLIRNQGSGKYKATKYYLTQITATKIINLNDTYVGQDVEKQKFE